MSSGRLILFFQVNALETINLRKGSVTQEQLARLLVQMLQSLC